MANSVNRSQLAELCGCNLSTVDNWVRDGCPFIRRPVRQGVGQWEFSPPAVFQWRLDRERQAMLGEIVQVDENEARRRKLAAEAGLAELELHLANGAAVKISDQEKVWIQMVGSARARLLSIPTKLGPMLAIETDPVVCQAFVESALVEALTELSGFEPPTGNEAGTEELSDDAVDARLAAVAGLITRIRNSAASNTGTQSIESIIAICDSARAEIFGVSDKPGGPGESTGVRQEDHGDLGASAEANGKRVGRPRKKAKSGVK
jgi:phage terminase Nu1 subunit (DNA packaging protein)